jgi:hypothetical protein
MRISPAGLDLIKTCEGFRGSAYRDGSGVWTIAWGHTQGVRDGDRCDRAQGEAWLAEDLAWAEAAVRRQMSAPASHNDLPFSVLLTLFVLRPIQRCEVQPGPDESRLPGDQYATASLLGRAQRVA